MNISNETKVGALTVISVTILVLGYNFLVGNQLWQEKHSYYAIYNSIKGLTVSNHVQINGLQVGRVTNLQLASQKKGNIIVKFNVNKKIQVPRNTVAEIISSDLLGKKAIKLRLGSDTAMAQPGDTLKTALQPDLSEEVRQEVLPVKLKAEKLLSSLDSMVTIIRFILDENTRQSIQNSLASIERTVQNFTRTSKTLDTLVQSEATRLDKILADVKSITGNLQNNNKQISHMLNNVSAITDSVRQARVKTTLAQTRKTLQDFSASMNKINQGKGSLGKLVHDEQLYQNLNNSAKDLDSLVKDMKAHPDRYVHFSIIDFGGGKDE